MVGAQHERGGAAAPLAGTVLAESKFRVFFETEQGEKWYDVSSCFGPTQATLNADAFCRSAGYRMRRATTVVNLPTEGDAS